MPDNNGNSILAFMFAFEDARQRLLVLDGARVDAVNAGESTTSIDSAISDAYDDMKSAYSSINDLDPTQCPPATAEQRAAWLS
jgi:hypothetical protein